MASPDIRCTADSVVLLRPLDQMRDATRRALTWWLWAHGVSPTDVVVGQAVERDADLGSLTWREHDHDGSVMRRWRYQGRCEDRLWPAPFPEALVDAAAEPDVEMRRLRLA